MALNLLGNSAVFQDIGPAEVSKSEWGMDVLERRVKGSYLLLNTYLSGLNQGQGYNGFYLQSWSVDRDPRSPTVILVYKGLLKGLPEPIAVDDWTVQTVSISADFDPPLTIGKETRVADDGTKSTVDVTTSGATRDIEFDSPQTIYHYIAQGRPAFATYSAVSGGRTARVRRSVISIEGGRRYTGSVPLALSSALFVEASSQVTGPNATPVVGTPYFECQDIVQHGYWV